jgi:hypothetical protein
MSQDSLFLRRRAWWGVGVVGLTLLACFKDQLTAPKVERTPDGGRPLYSETSLGTSSIPIPLTNTTNGSLPCCYTESGDEDYTGSGITVPAGTFFRIRVNGAVSVSTNPVNQTDYPGWTYSSDGSYGPGGTGTGSSDLLILLRLRYTDGSGYVSAPLMGVTGGSSAPDSAYTDIMNLSKAVEVQYARVGLSGVTSGSHGVVGQYDLGSGQSLEVVQVVNFLTVTANPTAVHAGDSVVFTAARTDGGSISINSWTWAHDASNSWAGPGTCWAFNPCGPRAILYSGTMTVSAGIGSGTTTASAHVTVYTSFSLSEDKTMVWSGYRYLHAEF